MPLSTSWYEFPPDPIHFCKYIDTHYIQKERRYDRWQRNETINLVRAYLVCLDELTVLRDIFSKKLNFFQRLREDCDNFPEPQDNLASEIPHDVNKERIEFAEHMMEESSSQCKQLGADLRESLNSVYGYPLPPNPTYVFYRILLTYYRSALPTSLHRAKRTH